MVIALPGLAVLAGLIVAWGLIYMGRAFVEALFGILTTVLKYSGAGLVFRAGGWVLGKLGVDAPNPVTAAHQWIADKLGTAANHVGEAISLTWHMVARITEDLGWTIWNVATAVDRLRAFVTDIEHLAKLVVGTSAFALAVKALRANVTRVVHDTTTIVKQLANPVATPIGATIKVVTRVDRAAVSNLRAWTVRKVHALEAAIAAAGAEVLPWPGTAVGDLRGQLAKLRKRVGQLERPSVAAIGTGALVWALGRAGLSWARCSNVNRVGKGICRLDPDGIDTLLAGTTLIVGTVSIRTLARELTAVTDEAAELVRGFIRER